MTDTTSQFFFEEKYQSSSDPWRFASSSYELSRYATIVRALAHKRYRHAFEPGCSIGVLTEKLSTLCVHLEAIDISPTAAQQARRRCAAMPNVTVKCAGLADYASASSDLLVLCEIGYYFSESDLRKILARYLKQLEPHGTILASHWLGTSLDHLLSGDAVHEIIASIPELDLEYSDRCEGFRLDRWKKLEQAHS